jgi:hypothetical protein
MIMLEKRSKDGKMLCVGRYDNIDRHYAVDVYQVDKLVYTYTLLEFAKSTREYILDTIAAYNKKHPTTQRYHKLTTGDIYCNETDTIINHTALIGLLSGLESKDKKAVDSAISALTQ